MIEPQALSRRFSGPSFGLWVGLTMVGFILAGDFHISASGPTTPFHLQDIDLFAAVIGFVFGAVSGLVIGSLQWLVLKSWMPNARLWIPFNVVGYGLVHALNDAVPLSLPLILVIGGIIVGLAQTTALRHALSRPLVWVPVTGFAWFLGFQLGFAWLNVNGIAGNPLAGIVTAHGTAGLMIGAITGVALRLLIADNLAVSKNLTRPTLTSRWSNLNLFTRILLLFLLVAFIAVFVGFAGMMLGMI